MRHAVSRGRLSPAPGEALSQAHLIVRLRQGRPAAQVEDLIAARFPAATVEDLFPAARPAVAAASAPEGKPLVALLDYLRIALPAELDPAQAAAWLHRLGAVDSAYQEGQPIAPAGMPAPFLDDADDTAQHYLRPAPLGIDAEHAWNVAGGTGAGAGLIDVEQGWVLNHQDLPPGIPLLTGRNMRYFGHGTAVLGVLAAVDKGRGVVGIAPGIGRLSVVSQWMSEQEFCTARAVFAAALRLQPGDVLLLEAQTTCRDVSGMPGIFPIEIEPAVQSVIRWAVARGITVVEAAGNGDQLLDGFDHPVWGRVLDRPSGAIMVGAATAGLEHTRIAGSNFGRRVDCYAWGEQVATTGDGADGRETDRCTEQFGGTSAASAIVAGAAVVLQGIARAYRGAPLSPADLRALFRDPAAGTASARPADDRIGVMPDLKKAVARIACQRS